MGEEEEEEERGKENIIRKTKLEVKKQELRRSEEIVGR